MPNLTLKQNIYGIENEYTCLVVLPNENTSELVGVCHGSGPYDYVELLEEPEDNTFSSIPKDELAYAIESTGLYANYSGMLSNGGKLYADPSGPEYATPETTTAEEAVHRSFDGDEILFRVFRSLQKSEIIESFQINRRCTDHNRTSRGVHLNVGSSLGENPNEQTVHALSTLNIAKGAIFGSGGLLLNDEGGTDFYHSPRLALTTTEEELFNNYSERPLVRVPFKTDRHSVRIETVTSDALNYAWPLRASMVMTSALVRLIEIDHDNPNLPRLMHGHVGAAQSVGRYGARAREMRIERNGEMIEVKPLDIIKMISETAVDTLEHYDLSDKETSQVLREVIEVADKLETDPFSTADQVESIGRLAAMERRMEKDNLTLDTPQLCRYDYAWDWIGAGIAEHLRSKNRVGWQGFSNSYSITRTNERIKEPPQDTRAKIRGEEIAKQHGRVSAGWDTFDIDKKEGWYDPLEITPKFTDVTD